MSESNPTSREPSTSSLGVPPDDAVEDQPNQSVEIGGRASELDPTRYGDWEKNGRCIDF